MISSSFAFAFKFAIFWILIGVVLGLYLGVHVYPDRPEMSGGSIEPTSMS